MQKLQSSVVLVTLMTLTLYLISSRLCCAHPGITLAYFAGNRSGDFKHVGGAFFLALSKYEPVLSDMNITVNYDIRDVPAFDEVKGFKEMVDVALTTNATAFFGPDHYCSCVAPVATALGIPYLAYDCVYTPPHSRMKNYWVVNTQPSDIKVALFIRSFIIHNNWTSYTIIRGTTDMWKEAARILRNITEPGIRINHEKAYAALEQHSPANDKGIYRDMVRDTYKDTRVYVFLGAYGNLIEFLVAMKNLSLSADYAVIATDFERNVHKSRHSRYFRNIIEEKRPLNIERLNAFRNLVVLTRLSHTDTRWEETGNEIYDRNTRDPINLPVIPGYTPPTKIKAAYLYDAVELYMTAVIKVANNSGDVSNASQVIEQMRNTTYQSVSGLDMYIDEMGDNEGNYTLWSMDVQEGRPQERMLTVGMFVKSNGNSTDIVFHPHDTNRIAWTGGSVPLSDPVCGFRGEKCHTQPDRTVVIVCIIVGIIVVIIAIVLAFRHYLYEQKLDRLLWKINRTEITFLDDDDVTIDKKPLYHRWTALLLPQDGELEELFVRTPRAESDFTLGMYRGTQVVIKQVTKKTLEITRALKKQLQLRKELSHENINRFVGACIETPQIYIVCTFCTRKSLHDIIQNKDSPLDDMFVSSLLADLIKGMTYIHDSRIISHGNLKSGNCLVDSRWVLQIADFGLHYLYSSNQSGRDEKKQYIRMQWRAPELLREGNREARGTQKGDVYSFALILYDIHSREGPWGNMDMTVQDIVQRVCQYDLQDPFRPPTGYLPCPPYVTQCMKECWAETPESRPDFKVIKQKLRDMHQGLKNNIFDNMLAIMEKYATNLEIQVAERTRELTLEKKMTENLLLRMLPRSVAERLKQNMPVIPEQYENVSIYFSDIVGFTSIAAKSTPMQVVGLLNDLYSFFDAIIEHYDVYKVETIGDAYMVVSGLPIRNEDKHAGEIASLSLNLLDKIRYFPIKHMPDASIQIRIGIHSGSCCAGVVGLKMPRYCLFGDTVNTASRMETTGEAMKIHCSGFCKDKLELLGGYFLEERGVVSMKGKGEQYTYFLVGEDASHREKRISEEKVSGRDGRCVSIGNLDYAQRPSPKPPQFRNSRMLQNSHQHDNNSKNTFHNKLSITREGDSVDMESRDDNASESVTLLPEPDSFEMQVLFTGVPGEDCSTDDARTSVSCDSLSLTSGQSRGSVIYSRSNSRN